MKKIYHIFTVALIAIIACSCTHNNGDIGDYFGTWKLETITVDNTVDAEYDGNLFWKFQTSVFCLQRVDERHSSETRYGTWEQIDNILRLDFTHKEDKGETIYTPFPESRLYRGVTDLKIVSFSSSEMKLNYTDKNGKFIQYKLKKW